MEEELIKKIEEHLATFPIRNKELEDMKKEWASFQRKIATTLYTSIFLFVSYGIWVGTMQTTISHLELEQDTENRRYEMQDTRLNSLEINNGEIKVKLANIEATLQEIKRDIQKIR